MNRTDAMHVSYRDILTCGHPSASEAASLVLAAARELERTGRGHTLPAPDRIHLSSSGQVSLAAFGEQASERERVRQVAALLRELLALDGGDGVPRARVPGRLLVLLARASGEIDAPPPSPAELTAALSRLGSADPATLASLHSRCVASAAGTDTAGVRLAATALPVRRVWDVAMAGRHVAAVAGSMAAGWLLAVGLADRPASRAGSSSHADVAAHAPIADRSRPSTAPKPLPEKSSRPFFAAPLVRSDAVGRSVFSPSFAPDGRGLLFHAGREQSALMRASFGEGGEIHVETLLQDGAANYHATLSPDRRRVAYDSDRDGTRGVYVARADASEPRKISGGGYAAVPSWSPDGRRLAFIRAEPRRPRVWNVWMADLETGQRWRVSRHTVGQAWRVCWFPDGERIAYSVESSLVVASLRDGSSRVWRSPIPGRLVRTPAVSPDGRWIVFQVQGDGAWLLDIARGRMRRVLEDRTAEEFTWSPDGRQVAYHARRGGEWSVWQLSFAPV